jgi:hypothetical protein
MREECRLRVLENRVLRRIFGPRRDEVTGEWRRLHNEELYAVYSSQNIIQVIKSIRMRWGWHVAHMGNSRGAHRFLVGKPKGRSPLGRPRCRWKVNITMDLREVEWEHRLDRSGSGYRHVVGYCECGDKPSSSINAGNFLSSLGHVSFSESVLCSMELVS